VPEGAKPALNAGVTEKFLPETAPVWLVLGPPGKEVLFLVVPCAITKPNRKMILLL
jgi:hypothetical protein